MKSTEATEGHEPTIEQTARDAPDELREKLNEVSDRARGALERAGLTREGRHFKHEPSEAVRARIDRAMRLKATRTPILGRRHMYLRLKGVFPDVQISEEAVDVAAGIVLEAIMKETDRVVARVKANYEKDSAFRAANDAPTVTRIVSYHVLADPQAPL